MGQITIRLPRQVQWIIQKLKEQGFEAYAVGGCVRDSILGREPEDWDITTSAKPEEIKAFLTWFRSLKPRPQAKTFKEVTRWWLNHPNPLNHQQALWLKDELYRYYLSHTQLKEKAVLSLVSKGLITEDEYKGILLWYLDGHNFSFWLGSLGLDGTGNIYGLITHYLTPQARQYSFYLLDDYYRQMNHIL